MQQAKYRDRFTELLKHLREARRWSQERLANESEMDHSLVSRLEKGDRNPTRENIEKLIAGMDLDPEVADLFRMAAGYMPVQPAHTIADERGVASLYAYLTSPNTSEPKRAILRQLIENLALLAWQDAIEQEGLNHDVRNTLTDRHTAR